MATDAQLVRGACDAGLRLLATAETLEEIIRAYDWTEATVLAGLLVGEDAIRLGETHDEAMARADRVADLMDEIEARVSRAG